MVGRPGSDQQVRAGRGPGGPRRARGGRGRAKDAVLVEPMESPGRPDAAGPQGRVAEEVPPPGGESRCVSREPPFRGEVRVPGHRFLGLFRPVESPSRNEVGLNSRAGWRLRPRPWRPHLVARPARFGGLGSAQLAAAAANQPLGTGSAVRRQLAGNPDVHKSFCCSALGKAGGREEDDVEDCASPCVEGNCSISGPSMGPHICSAIHGI